MIPMPSGVRVWIATGHTDMRRGMQGLALQVQEQLKRDPHGGDLYLFRAGSVELAKIERRQSFTPNGHSHYASGMTAVSSRAQRRGYIRPCWT
jgi:transposase